MTTLNVQIFGDRALIEHVPSIAARIICGRRTTETYAVRSGGQWTEDDTGKLVSPDVAAAIQGAR